MFSTHFIGARCQFGFQFFIDTSTHFAVREQCKVIFSYKPANEDELELKEGEIISILSKELPDKGWWKGELKGKIGVFPDNFVQSLSADGKAFHFVFMKYSIF